MVIPYFQVIAFLQEFSNLMVFFIVISCGFCCNAVDDLIMVEWIDNSHLLPVQQCAGTVSRVYRQRCRHTGTLRGQQSLGSGV